MNLFAGEFKEKFMEALSCLNGLADEERVDLINWAKAELHRANPITNPVGAVQWVPIEKVAANDYNPNKVAPPEMRLLHLSIAEDGYTQPVVCFQDGDNYIVVDGFHRTRIAKEKKDIQAKTMGRVPIVVIDKPLEERMASTIRHNRARGKHGVAPMSELVATLYQAGWTDDKIAKHLGMDMDEVLRLKQVTGLPDLFKDREYSRAWE